MYVCMCVYVAICLPRAHHTRTCMQIDTVKIVSIDHVPTLNVAYSNFLVCMIYVGLALVRPNNTPSIEKNSLCKSIE